MTGKSVSFRPEGALAFANAAALLQEGEAFLRQHEAEKTVVFDFSAITRVDSSALALACAWQRRAQAAAQQIHWQALPAAMQSLAAVYGLEDFFTVSATP